MRPIPLPRLSGIGSDHPPGKAREGAGAELPPTGEELIAARGALRVAAHPRRLQGSVLPRYDAGSPSARPKEGRRRMPSVPRRRVINERMSDPMPASGALRADDLRATSFAASAMRDAMARGPMEARPGNRVMRMRLSRWCGRAAHAARTTGRHADCGKRSVSEGTPVSRDSCNQHADPHRCTCSALRSASDRPGRAEVLRGRRPGLADK